jgi:AcrR family transcriptional regulator
MARRSQKDRSRDVAHAGQDAARAAGGRRSAAREGARAANAVARRAAILDAALDEFSAAGFAAARLDDVAKRAGVAKGTIYLHFADKEALFQELVRFQLTPVVGAFEAALASDLPLHALMERAVEIFSREVFGTRRQLILRLIISEGPRFPALAEFHYREVVGRVLEAVRGRLARARARGEVADDTLLRFPQLLGAPMILSVVWQGLFDRFEPLDAAALMRAYFDRLFGGAGRGE